MHKNLLRKVVSMTLLGHLTLLGLGACAHEGPAERAGKHVDNAADKAKHDIKKATD
jgi:hypothetical protein